MAGGVAGDDCDLVGRERAGELDPKVGGQERVEAAGIESGEDG